MRTNKGSLSISHDAAELLTEIAARARQRWPGIQCDLELFRKHLERVRVTPAALALHGEDLFLAATCTAADPVALRIFEAQYTATIAPCLKRFRAGPDFTQEVQQELRCRLLAPPEARIATYQATGPLAAWVRVAAVRVGLNLRRTVRRRAEDLLVDELLVDVPMACDHAERSWYSQILAAAIREAFAQLPRQQRNLLRLHYADRLSLQQLADLDRVHRATIARRLVEARQSILDQVESEVRGRLSLTSAEFQSILGFIDSRLGVALSSLLLDNASVR